LAPLSFKEGLGERTVSKVILSYTGGKTVAFGVPIATGRGRAKISVNQMF